jgi:hypothetical protein
VRASGSEGRATAPVDGVAAEVTAAQIRWRPLRFAGGVHGLFTDLNDYRPRRTSPARPVTWYFAVDVAWTWSKRQDLADQLRSKISRLTGQDPSPAEDRQVSPRTTAKAVVPKQVVDRLGETAVRELIEARRAGAKLRELVDRYGISESSVKRLTCKRA